MEIQFKQRLVGVMVLVALGIIFLPSLFHRDQRVAVDTTTLIPPKPTVQPVTLKPIARPANVKPAPVPEKAFQPPVVAVSPASKAKLAEKMATSKPSLNKQGLPNAWVIQVSSYQSQARAGELKKKLQQKQYKAYTRGVKTTKGQFFRVFAGPYIDKSRALKAQSQIDKLYRVKSQVLRFAPQ